MLHSASNMLAGALLRAGARLWQLEAVLMNLHVFRDQNVFYVENTYPTKIWSESHYHIKVVRLRRLLETANPVQFQFLFGRSIRDDIPDF